MVKNRRYTRRKQRGRGFLSALGSAAKGIGSIAAKGAKGVGSLASKGVSKVKGIAQKRLEKKGMEMQQQQTEPVKLEVPNADVATSGLNNLIDASAKPPQQQSDSPPPSAPPSTSTAVDLARAAATLNKAGFTDQAKILADKAAKLGGKRRTRRKKRRTHFQ